MDGERVTRERPARESREKRPRREYNASRSRERSINFPTWERADNIRDLAEDDYISSREGNESFECPSSQTLMLNPVGLVCGHVFDERSIQDYIRKPPNDRYSNRIKCPICRVVVPKSTLVPQPLVKALIGEKVKMKCPSAGCDEVMKYDRWEAHIKSACPHTRMLCVARDEEGSKCGAIVPRQAKGGHELECPHRPVKCSRVGCSKLLLYKDLKKHEEGCEFRMIDCACGERMTAKVNPAHRASVCPEEEVPCTICSVKLKRKDLEVHQSDPQSFARHLIALTSRLQTSEARNEKLMAENKDLAERLESVEIMKEDYIKLKAENETIHERLDWCRRESQRLAELYDEWENGNTDGSNDDGAYNSEISFRGRSESRPRRRGRSESPPYYEAYGSEGGRCESRFCSRNRSESRSPSCWYR